jgi:D-alanyl-lipoteichoic acid acyltransferase DltB (MBOAT superfamily)
LAASAGFLWTQHPDPGALAVLAAFVLSGFGAAHLVRGARGRLAAALYIVALTAAFIILKRYEFLRLIPGDTLIAHALDLVGLSFIFFRQIHYVVDVSQGAVTKLDPFAYMVYQLNPFSLLAGPIQRYQVFAENWSTLAPLTENASVVRRAYFRILVGVIKVAVVAELILYNFHNAPEMHPALVFAWRFYLFPAYVYFNFAGYCDIVIAAARLFGIALPENFDRPYLARNMIEYWNRWHRSLTFWIRDYVFTPLYMAIARTAPALAPHLVFVCYFVALFLAGVWHGATWNFVIFGLLNAIGVSGAKIWENIIIARAGRKGLRAYLESKPILWLARIATFHFVCVTMVFLRPESTQALLDILGALRTLAMGS